MFSNNRENFSPNWFEKVDETIGTKLKALKCYKKEMRKTPHPRSIDGIKTLSKWRGAISGYKYAEAFLLVRCIN